MKRQNLWIQFSTVVMMALFGNVSALPSNALRLYLDKAPTDLDRLSNHITKSSNYPWSAKSRIMLIEDLEPVVVYLTDNANILSSLLQPRNQKTNRPRRTLPAGIHPMPTMIDYQQIWPTLNAAKDRAVELTEEGYRRKDDKQSVNKRQEWDIPEANERLARYSRNVPEQEKMFQIHTVGDLPMFRFG